VTALSDLASLSPDTLAAISAALSQVPQNGNAWTYTINGLDGSPYITRTLLPRVGSERLMIHHIHRPDADRWLHNHPWKWASFRIVSGGYVEERLVDGTIITNRLRPGDVNHLTHETFHRVVAIEPNTWTVGLIGERMQTWGFLVDGVLVESSQYFAQQGYQTQGVKS
jgi:hypothetical protein